MVKSRTLLFLEGTGLGALLRHRRMTTPGTGAGDSAHKKPDTLTACQTNDADKTKPVCKTMSYADAPTWMRDTPYITSGYRRVTYEYHACLASVFGYLHNESGTYK